MATLTARKPHMSTEVADAAQRVAALADGWSLESTLANDDDVALLNTIVPSSLQVYLSAVPTRDPAEQMGAAVRLHRAGYAPVPHVAVRNFATTEALDSFLGTMAHDAGVRRVLVIAGDRVQPAGPFRSAVEAIASGVMPWHGIGK